MGYNFSQYFQVFLNRRIGVILLLGFASGLPLSLTGGTLQAWLSVEGVDLRTIGVLSLAGLPYTLKFLWSPVMDRFTLPWLGRRRGWIVMCQLLLVGGITLMAFGNPSVAPLWLGMLAVMVAFISASQDIVIDAYRTDVLRERERGTGAAVFVSGYRVAMIVAGALALILSDQIGWRNTYLVMACVMATGVLATFAGNEPEAPARPPRTLNEAVAGPFRDFMTRTGAYKMLILIILYKLCDAYAGSMTVAFLIRGLGFSATDVGTINKFLGLVALILGAMFGGAMMVRLGLFRALLIFGILQALSNLSFVVLALLGKNYPVMVGVVALENITGGMGTAAFIALLMALCNKGYSATQYALLSSLASLGRVMISPTSGFLVEYAGWVFFFVFTVFTAIPGLIVLWWLRGEIVALSQATGDAG